MTACFQAALENPEHRVWTAETDCPVRQAWTASRDHRAPTDLGERTAWTVPTDSPESTAPME